MSWPPRVRRGVRRVSRYVAANVAEPSVPLVERYPQHRIGRGTYGPLEVRDDGDGGSLTIGNYTSIGPGVQVFLGGNHRPDWVTTFPFNVRSPRHASLTGHPATRGPVVIGNDVWLGAESLVLSGVTIGDGAVVAARSVVSRDVAPYAVVAGAPAVEVRRRFDDAVAEALLRIRWWDWDEDEIDRAVPWLLQSDIAEFLRRAESGDFDG